MKGKDPKATLLVGDQAIAAGSGREQGLGPGFRMAAALGAGGAA